MSGAKSLQMMRVKTKKTNRKNFVLDDDEDDKDIRDVMG